MSIAPPYCAAFAPPIPLHPPLSSPPLLSRRPRRAPLPPPPRVSRLSPTSTATPPSDEPPLFVASSDDSLLSLDDISLSAPLTPEEREAVLRSLPPPVARFLIRRAEEALLPEDARPAGSRAAKAAGLRAERARTWLGAGREELDDSWYEDYISDEVGEGLDEFGRMAVKGEGEEVFAERPELGDGAGVALFAGSPSDPKEQGQSIWYGVLALALALVALKVILAFVQFFVSFTFSFLAIFALSAGIFVFFFIARF